VLAIGTVWTLTGVSAIFPNLGYVRVSPAGMTVKYRRAQRRSATSPNAPTKTCGLRRTRNVNVSIYAVSPPSIVIAAPVM
jgi:hypothetical protein